MGFVQSMTNFIDALLNNNTKDDMEAMKSMSSEDLKLVYDSFFIFALMWTIGGAVADDKMVNHRKAFNSMLRSMARTAKIPDSGECFDYRYEPQLKECQGRERTETIAPLLERARRRRRRAPSSRP